MIDLNSCETLAQLWDARVKDTPGHPFLTFEPQEGSARSYTYEEFDCLVRASQAFFLEHGVRRNDRVLLCSRNCPEILAARLAIACIGATFSSVNPALNADDIQIYLSLCKPMLFLSFACFTPDEQQMLHDKFPDIRLYFSDSPRSFFGAYTHHPSNFPRSEITSLDTADIIFTSGTTAEPKALEVTHANIINASRINAIALSLRPDDRFIIAVPLFHVDAPYTVVAPCILLGATIILLERYSASHYIAQCVRYGATVSFCVAMMIKTIMLQPKSACEKNLRLRQVSFFMPLTQKERDDFEHRFSTRLINCYGLSESITSVTMDRLTGPNDSSSVGSAIYPFEVRVFDNKGKRCPRGSIGEIWVRGIPGVTVMKGYFENEDATSTTIVNDEWLRTGDIGFLDSQNNLHFIDRIKNIIKCKGENISGAEIENFLMSLDGIQEAAVIGASDTLYSEKVLAFISLDGTCHLSVEQILERCKAKLSSFKVPSAVIILPSLPHTGTGRVNRCLLEERMKNNLLT